MPTQNIANELFLEHKEVKVFHVYKDNNFDSGRRMFWYTTDSDGSEDGEQAFDVRDLSWTLKEIQNMETKEKIKKLAPEQSEYHQAIISLAIDAGLVKAYHP